MLVLLSSSGGWERARGLEQLEGQALVTLEDGGGGLGSQNERKRAKATERRDQAGGSSAIKSSLLRWGGSRWEAEGQP